MNKMLHPRHSLFCFFVIPVGSLLLSTWLVIKSNGLIRSSIDMDSGKLLYTCRATAITLGSLSLRATYKKLKTSDRQLAGTERYSLKEA